VLVNGKKYIDAVSSWMILDKSTHRPAKIDQIGKEVPGIKESYLDLPSTKIPTLEPTNKTFEKTINYSDIDINLHVNNGKYVEILTDSLADKLISGSVIGTLDIQYLSESQLGDNIFVYQHDEDLSNVHLSMANSTRSKETCRCRISWKD
jgi:acyl-ACP thioesterase